MLIPWIMAPSRRGSCCRCYPCWPLTISLVISVFQGVHSQTVLVNDSISGYIGSDVILHCSFINPLPSVKITQVTWQKSTNGSKQNVAIYNPAMGVSILPPYKGRVDFQNPSFRDGTIQLNRLQLEDEGAYICEFATFPAGNKESQLNLTVLAKPTNQMEGTSKQLVAVPRSKEKVVVATCTSANGKPPSSLSWETKLNGEAEFQEIKNENGTVTVISRYRLVPTREAHRQPLTCVINYLMDRQTETTTLNVLYEPQVSIEGFDGNWYVKRAEVKLTCKADANPPPSSFHWRMANGSLPDSAEVKNSTLYFRGPVTYSLSGIYICEARNTIGSHTGQVEVNVTEFPFTPTPTPGQKRSESSMLSTAIIGGAVGGVLLVLAVSIFLFVVLRRRHHTFKGDYNTKKHIYGNGYSKAGVAQHPPMAQSLQYPDDSDDEKKPGPVGSSYEEEEEEEDGRKLGPKYDDESKRPYFTVEEGERRGYSEDRTLGYQYEPEDLPDSLVPQNDGSFISKKEWAPLSYHKEPDSDARFQSVKRQCRSANGDKPLRQGPSGSLLGIIGGVVAALLIITASVSTFLVRRKKQKQRSNTDSDMTDLPPSHKPVPPPKKKPEMKTHLTAHDIQVVHLDPVKAEEEIITLPIQQTPYYDMSASDNAPYCEQRMFGDHCPELPECREFLSGRCLHEDVYLDQLHPGYVPLSFFLQDSLTRPTPESTFCYPPAGSRAPYVCPKEQYV